MQRRVLAIVILTGLLVACGTPLENAMSTFVEQVRLGDPAAQQTYADNRELLESAEAVPMWVEQLETAEAPAVKRWAANILGNVADESSVQALSNAMSDANRDVRDAATDAIAKFDPEIASRAYADALDGSRDAQAAALAAIARMGSDAQGAVDAVANLASQGGDLLADTAMNTLADIGSAEAATELGNLAMNTSLSMEQRVHAVQALQRVDDPAAQEVLSQVSAAIAEEEGADELRDAVQ